MDVDSSSTSATFNPHGSAGVGFAAGVVTVVVPPDCVLLLVPPQVPLENAVKEIAYVPGARGNAGLTFFAPFELLAVTHPDAPTAGVGL
jgi:hypothetical protein